MLKQKGEKIVPLGINYSNVLKQELDTKKQEKQTNTSANKKEDEQPDTDDDFKGMMSLF